MRLIDVDPVNDRPGWLKRRRDGLGGSDVAKVLGISGFGSPWSVYVEKIGAVEPDALEPTDQQIRGRYLEDGVLAWYADETGFTVGFKQAMIVHPEHEWAFCTVDGLVFEGPEPDDPEAAVKGVDAKTTSEWGWERVPVDYQAQAQWSMFVTGLPEWDLAVSHPGGFRIYTVEADPADQEALFEGARRFWHDHVLAGVPPEVTDSDNRLLAEVWPHHEPGTEVEVDADLVRELVRVKAELKRLEKRQAELEAQLKAKLGDTQVGTVNGRKVISWQAQSGGARRFDEDSFRAENPFMVNRFEKEKVVKYLDLEQLRKEEPDVFERYDRPVRVFRTHVKLEELEGNDG